MLYSILTGLFNGIKLINCAYMYIDRLGDGRLWYWYNNYVHS